MITRKRIFLDLTDEALAPEASRSLEREGYAVIPSAFSPDEVAALRADIERVYTELPGDPRNTQSEEREDFRYEMLNRSAVCQRAVADRRILDVIEPLLGEDCHIIANTAWRNPPRAENDHGGGNWHIDAGPHVPRPAGVPWDDRIPYPVFAIGVHLLLEDCPADAGPTGVLPGSHRSGQHPPFDRLTDADLEYEGRKPVLLTGKAGDLAMFASDVWHRRMPSPGEKGRFFLQLHYGRRDIAQRLRPTRDVHHLSDEALSRAESPRERSVVGLHPPLFYDG
ncbi:MAG: phytanoyl-CoA dioxygenase family protein [Myxococcota bacterium]|nr:phytanoyl-CoA dioxygenase family protein [Myxococcota bacterium]